MTNRIVITCLIILVCACLLIGIIVIAGVGVYTWDKNNPRATITSAPTASIHPELTSCPPDSCLAPTLVTAQPTSDLPKDISRIMDGIQEEVIEIRGLTPTTYIPRALLSPDQLRLNVIEDFLAEYTPDDAQNDAILLSALGLLSQDFDLLTFYEDLYSEQIAGYYDDETKEMYVVSGTGFGGPEKMTYAHEFTHILQDQNYDFQNGLGMGDKACELDSERCSAISSLIEGDASLTEYLWYFQYASDQDQSDVQTFYENFDSPVYDSSPEFMKEDFLFPYSAGQEFVQVLFDQGGWRGVNNAYANPPVSTEQIMHPSRYPADVPVKVELPDLSSVLGDGWEQLQSDVVGEWYTYLIFAKGYEIDSQLDDDTARKAAEGWGGDAFQLYSNSNTNQIVLIIKYIWDTDRDAQEYTTAFKQYGISRWGTLNSLENQSTSWQTDRVSVLMWIDSPTTLLVIAPDRSTIDIILQTLDLE
jgi:hypothetical protein